MNAVALQLFGFLIIFALAMGGCYLLNYHWPEPEDDEDWPGPQDPGPDWWEDNE